MKKMSGASNRNSNVVLVGLLSFFGGISQDIFTPILPIYYTSILGFDKTFVGVAEGLVTASSYLWSIIAGFFSDKFRRQKPIIFMGYALSMISRPLLALASSAPAVIGLRVLDGTGKGIKDPPKDVLIAGSAARDVRGKSFGIARMLDTLGSVAGPLILFGLLYMLKGSASLYHAILLLTAVPLVVTLALLAFGIKEIEPRKAPAAAPVSPIASALPSQFYIFLAIVALFTLGNSSDAFLILRARSLGITLLEIPLVIACFNFVYAMLAVPFGSLSDRIGRVPTMLIGWASYALVYLGFAFASQAYLAWFLYGFYGIYYATSQGVAKALLADMVQSGHRGKAFGIYGFTVGCVTLIASFAAGYLWDRFGPQAPFYFGALAALAAAACLAACARKLGSAAWYH